jgi:hypothetical protein
VVGLVREWRCVVRVAKERVGQGVWQERRKELTAELDDLRRRMDVIGEHNNALLVSLAEAETRLEESKHKNHRKESCISALTDLNKEMKSLVDAQQQEIQDVLAAAQQENLEKGKFIMEKEKRLERKALKVVERMLRTGLGMAFERWRERFEEKRELRMKAGKVVMRLMGRGLVMAFERWQDHTAEEKQMKSKALKVVQRMLNGALVWSFERWRDNIIEEKQLKSKALKVELNAWHRTTLVA